MMWLARQPQPPGCRDHLLPSLRRLILASLRLFSRSAGCGNAPEPPVEQAHFMVDYLVRSCGLSRAEALKASKPFAHLKSPERPDDVLRLLRQEGLDDAHIKQAVLLYPRMLLSNAKKTLEPKIRALRGAGFSGPEVAQLISLNPTAVYFRDVLRRVGFWRELLGSNRNLLKSIKGDKRLPCYSLDGWVIPRLSLLRRLGVPDDRMVALLLGKPLFMSAKPAKIKSLVEQVKSLGFSPGLPMFVTALSCVSNLSRSTLDAKSKLLKGFGWTQAEFASAVRKFPHLLVYSEKNIRAKMDFLLNEAGCEPSDIACRPTIIGFSMEKRLMPRVHVLQSLRTKGLLSGRKGFSTVMMMTENDFIRQYIIPYSGEHPELVEAYHAVCAKNVEANTDGI